MRKALPIISYTAIKGLRRKRVQIFRSPAITYTGIRGGKRVVWVGVRGKMKPPKYHVELQFLTPYLNDSEHRMSNIAPSPGYLEDEESDGEPEPTVAVPVPTPSPAPCDAQSLCSNSSTHGKRKKNSA